jgi:hypothetical protein
MEPDAATAAGGRLFRPHHLDQTTQAEAIPLGAPGLCRNKNQALQKLARDK